MNIALKIKTGIADFIKGLVIIFGKPKAGEGDRKLAKMSEIVVDQIPFYGKDNVRKQVIKAIEDDLRRAAKKGNGAVDMKVDNALKTPEYMLMLQKLNLDKSHLYVAAQQAKKVVINEKRI